MLLFEAADATDTILTAPMIIAATKRMIFQHAFNLIGNPNGLLRICSNLGDSRCETLAYRAGFHLCIYELRLVGFGDSNV